MFGFGWGYQIPQPENPKPVVNYCENCKIYHSTKFNGWKCICDCHPKENSDLDWDKPEEVTKPGFK